MSATAHDRLVDALERHGYSVVTRYGRTTAQCPAHDDTNPSLGIGKRRDGAGVVLVCRSHGCAAEDIMHAVGLTLRDLFDGDLPPGYVPPPRRETSPWDEAMRGLGLTRWPPIEHVLHRIAQHHDIPSTAPSRPDPEYRMPADVAADYAAWVREEGAMR